MEDELVGTVVAAVAFQLVELGARHGLPRDRLLAAAGLRDEQAALLDARVPTAALVVLWRELLIGLPDVIVPIALVAEAPRLPLGIVGPLVRSAADLRTSLELARRFRAITDSELGGELIVRGELTGLVTRHRPEVHALGFPLEAMLGWEYRALRQILGPALDLRAVSFSHAPRWPADRLVEFERFFGAPVRFGDDVCALWLATATLDAPFPTRDPEAQAHLAAHAERLLADLPPTIDPFLARLRETIAAELAPSGAELARVARRMALSPRTLQRRLADVGTTFQAVLDDVRAAAAQRLLRDRERTILDVAFELGYADLQSFYRAFKRWTGRTPAAWRA